MAFPCESLLYQWTLRTLGPFWPVVPRDITSPCPKNKGTDEHERKIYPKALHLHTISVCIEILWAGLLDGQTCVVYKVVCLGRIKEEMLGRIESYVLSKCKDSEYILICRSSFVEFVLRSM
jgi:hypothetical protein